MSENQKTIAQEVTVEGKGLHTGADVVLTFKPAPVNHGYKFQRVDLDDQPIIRAVAENVKDTSRGTTIEENGGRVSTIEHVLAALSGLGIDNALIEINAPETPILDGSSKLIVEALKKAGTKEQDAEREYYTVKEKITYKDDERGVEISIYPDDKFSLNVLIDYNSSSLLNQYATLDDLSCFDEEISKSRTFVFLHELEILLENNLIKGGDLSNAIVIVDKEVSQEELNRLADLLGKPHVQVKEQGILNNIDLHYNNEPARHKLLDIVGDLALIGMPIRGKIIAKRPGHLANTELAKLVRSKIKKEKTNSIPVYDSTKEPLLDINQIKKILPHRNPFLLVDKILEMDDTKVIGVKNVTMNEEFFVGHFPDEPVMPGVLLIEAMAQVGGILVLNTVSDPENYLTYFLKVENARFKRKVIPGDTIIFKLELTTPIRRGIANMKGKAYVGNTVVMESEMMAQISKKK